jgi:ABC-2 type transport system ATP-binding protein
LIRRLVDSNITILLSSHNMLEVEQTCRHAAIMRQGMIAFDGPMDELRARADDVDVEYRLLTGDDTRAATVARESEGIAGVRVDADGIRFYSQPEPVERLTARLGSIGIGVRQLELARTALETFSSRTSKPTPDRAVGVRDQVRGGRRQAPRRHLARARRHARLLPNLHRQ